MPPSTPQHKAFKNIFKDNKKGSNGPSARPMIAVSKLDEVQPIRHQKSLNVNNSYSRNLLNPDLGPTIQINNSYKLDTVGPDDIILDEISPQPRSVATLPPPKLPNKL